MAGVEPILNNRSKALNDFNTTRPNKGTIVNGIKMISFTMTSPCLGSRCPIIDHCIYVRSREQEWCMVEKSFIKNILMTMYDDVGDKMTQMLSNKITIQLIPLFQQLLWAKMQSFRALANDDFTYTTMQGSRRVNPIFKEVREILMAIQKVQSSLGMDREYIRALNIMSPSDERGAWSDRSLEQGDPRFWERWQTQQTADVVDPPAARERRRRKGPIKRSPPPYRAKRVVEEEG